MIKNKKSCTTEQLYVETMCLLEIIYKQVSHLNKDDKNMFGYNLVEDLKSVVLNFSHSYEEKEILKKYEYAEKIMFHLKNVEIQVGIMEKLSVLTRKQIVQIMLILGNLITQSEGWYNSLLKRIEKV